jgi:hypothetical protein
MTTQYWDELCLKQSSATVAKVIIRDCSNVGNVRIWPILSASAIQQLQFLGVMNRLQRLDCVRVSRGSSSHGSVVNAPVA